MMYKLVITEHADEQLDRLVYHLICRLKNKEAAQRLLDAIDDIYDRLISNPQQFPLSGVPIWLPTTITKQLQCQ